MMKEEAFAQLVESIKQTGETKRGERKPSQIFEVTQQDVKAIRTKLQNSQSASV